jgi:hypothetical protein
MGQRSLRGPFREQQAVAAALCLFYPLMTADVVAQTSVHRCTRPDGGVEFRQFPCPPGTSGEQILIEERRTGWTPPKSSSGGQKRGKGKSGSRPPRASDPGDAPSAGREDRCWKKRQLLDEVNWKLRRGYKPSKGIELRRRRRSYQDYIVRYCD